MISEIFYVLFVVTLTFGFFRMEHLTAQHQIALYQALDHKSSQTFRSSDSLVNYLANAPLGILPPRTDHLGKGTRKIAYAICAIGMQLEPKLAEGWSEKCER